MGRTDGCWVELGDGVLARRYAELDLTVGLVVGAERALVVDTRGDRAQGAELAAAIRAITTLPLLVMYTHAHFDHCFGTCSFPTTAVYAHPWCAAAIADTAEAKRAEWTAYYREHGDPGTAKELAATPIVPPTDLVERATLDLGGRIAVLHHPGRGHTDHDLSIHVPDSGVLFAGDLVEHGAPPDFSDAHPLHWPAAVAALLALNPRVAVPAGPHPDSARPCQRNVTAPGASSYGAGTPPCTSTEPTMSSIISSLGEGNPRGNEVERMTCSSCFPAVWAAWVPCWSPSSSRRCCFSS